MNSDDVQAKRHSSGERGCLRREIDRFVLHFSNLDRLRNDLIAAISSRWITPVLLMDANEYVDQLSTKPRRHAAIDVERYLNSAALYDNIALTHRHASYREVSVEYDARDTRDQLVLGDAHRIGECHVTRVQVIVDAVG